MARTVGLADVRRCAELIDQTVVLLRYGNGLAERDILTGIAERLRVDADEIEKERS